MKEIVKYIEKESIQKSAKWYVFDPMSSGTYRYFQSTLNDYLTAPEDMVNEDKDFRYSHLDIYYLCILGDSIPERFRIGDSLHPGGVYFSSEEKTYLKKYFLENRERIIEKVTSLSTNEEEFIKVLETLK